LVTDLESLYRREHLGDMERLLDVRESLSRRVLYGGTGNSKICEDLS